MKVCNALAMKLYTIVLSVALSCLNGCYRLPDEDALLRTFKEYKPELEKLVQMSTQDKAFRRIPAEGLAPVDMPSERFEQYRTLFGKLNVEGGLNRFAAYPNAVFIIAGSMVPIGGRGRMVGYAYSDQALTPKVNSLRLPATPFGPLRRHGEADLRFRDLDGGWYLFYRYE